MAADRAHRERRTSSATFLFCRGISASSSRICRVTDVRRRASTATTRSAISRTPCSGCSTCSAFLARMCSATRWAAPARCAWRWTNRTRSIGSCSWGRAASIRHARPTDGLNRLLDYYTGEGPTREKMATFLRQYLVYDGSRIPDSVVEARFRASTDPEVMANPPLVRPSGMPNMQALDFTRDDRLPQLPTPTLVLWGINDLVNRPSGGQSLQQSLPNCDLYLFSRTGHWVQWERPAEFNAVTIAFLSKPSPA